MSKKMWNKIFKSKSSSKQTKTNNKINNNKRCSIYEEYQQLNAATATATVLLSSEKQQQKVKSHNLQFASSKENATTPTTTTTTTTNDDTPLPIFQQTSTNLSPFHPPTTTTTSKPQSTFSKVVSTLTRSGGNGNAAKTKLPSSSKSKSELNTNEPPTTALTNATSRRSSQILIVVNKIVCADVDDETVDATIVDQAQWCRTAIAPMPSTPKSRLSVTTNPSVLHAKKHNNNSNSNIIAPTEDEPDPASYNTDDSNSLQLTPCPICSRTFNPVTLQKHVGICEKMTTKKRNIFDSSRQRREGTELATYPLPKGFGLPAAMTSSTVGGVAGGRHERGQSPNTQHVSSPLLSRKKSNDEFARNTTRTSMRKLSNSSNTGAGAGGPTTPTTPTAPATMPNSNFTRDRMRSSERSLAKRIQPPPAEQCPHCERCFGIKAYDRHVEWCKEKALQASIKITTKNEQNVAKERLEARTKYRAPCLKTKRSINRDKYSGFPGDENEESPKSVQNSTSIMSLSMTSSLTSERNAINSGDAANATASNSKNPEVTKSQQDFRLTGEQLETYGKKKRNKNIVLNAEQTHIEPVNELSKTLAAELDKLRQQDEYNGMQQDHSKDLLPPQKSDSHDLSTTLTLGVPKVGKSKSTTALVTAERKLSSKQKSHIKLKLGIEENALHTKQMLKESASMAALKTLSCMSLTQQKQAIFEMEMPTNATTSTAAAAAAATITKLPTTSSGTTLAATMHTKLETNPIKSPAICRPKRKKLVRQANSTSHSTPLKAIPLLKESIEIFGMPVMVLNSAGVGSTAADTSNVDNDKEIKIIKAPPNVPPLTRNRSFILSGLPGNYDPFLSAKRQLEELCSPTALAAKESNSSSPSPHSPTVQHNSQTHYTPSTTTTPSIPISPCTKMTTSLTLSSSTPLHSPSPLTPNNAQNRTLHTVSTNTKTTPPSNFRRTSSLRGPRRSPLLPSRPLFAQKHRPTIQRGLSDEGPISTNFLKPEEYDEMPVRSVCGNDFALTNSPRVVRRDTSLSNRKHNLKLNVNETATPAGLLIATAGAVTNSSDERLAATTASKYISKTDSLAVFLKYENELEKLNPSSETAPKGGTTSLPKPALEHTNSISNTPNVQSVQNLNSPVISKELKDKSNTLSKQNSAKNILLEPVESSAVEQQKSTVLLPTKPVVVPAQHSEKFTQATKKSNTENPVHNNKYGQLRLEPISKPGTPLSKPATPITKPMLSTPTLPLVGSVTHHQHRQQPINLNAIFSDVKPQTLGYNKERKLSSSSEYIDPKLINKCDNLPVNLTSGRVLKHSDSDSSERQRRNDTPSSSSASESSAPSTAATNVSSPFTKLLTLTAKVESTATTQPTQINHPSMPPPTQPSPMLSQRNSAEGRNLLKRKMRLGRNQFLYDASPEADSCSADDEANRSSVEYDETHFKPGAGFNTLSSQHQQQQHSIHPQSNMPIISPLPIFDDFDFEEFLSSFENDDEQFPLFKDCREFLMNRTSNKQRSTLKPNSNSSSHSNTNNNNNNNNNTNNNANNNNNRNVSQHFKHSSSQLQSPIAFVSNNHTHFQFPSITTNFTCPSLLTSPSTQSSFRSNSTLTDGPSKYSDLKPTSSNENFGITANDSHKKREIFISIETEQNEHGRSPISPASLRSMVGNPQAVVEVDAVDANDNKFSKIDDDEPLAPAATTLPTTTSSQLGGGISSRLSFENAHHLPNVQLNNAKNLIQKMQEDFRQLGEEVGANIRQAVVNNTTKQDNASLLYRDTVRPATSNAAGGISSAAARHHHQHHPSVDACVDSDDMSSLDGYPISSQSSRRGVGSKLSADSAYGSLSRQRSSELSTHRSLSRTRPSTANSATNTTIPTPMIDAATQHQQQQQQQQQQQLYKYSTMKSRSRQFSGSSSSGSDNSLPPIVCHNNLNNSNYQQQQQLSQLYNNGSNNNNNNSGSRYENLLNNNDNESSPLSSPTATTTVAGTTSATAATSPATTPFALSNSTSNQSMSASMKLSKFCHECGGKFVIEQAKFCMDCGVRRIVL